VNVFIRLLLFLSFIMPQAQVGAQDKQPSEPLTNDAIVQMVKAPLGVDVIVEEVRTSPGSYSLDYASLIKLKQQGVPDAVISAMQAKNRSESRTPRSKPLPEIAHGTSGSETKSTYDVWQVENTTDRVSRKRSFKGFMRHRTDDSQQPGELQVTATCDAELLKFQLVFLSDAKPGVGLKQNTTGGFGHAKPWVETRVRVDNDQPRTVASEEDYLNYATILFVRGPTQGHSPEDGAASIARYVVAAKSAGAIDTAIKGRSILMELTTENGAKELVEISPQEPSFKVFVSACDRVFWGGLTPFQQQSHGPAGDGFQFLYSLPLPEREYKGTIDGFAKALPDYFARASTTSGMTGRDFNKEIAFITDAVRTCGQITPEMANSVFVVKGTVWRKPDGEEQLEKLGSQFGVCNTKNGLGVSPAVSGLSLETTRGIVLTIHPIGSYNMSNGFARWGEGKGFTVQVFFSQMKGDDRDMRGGRLQPSYDYTILHGIIERP